MISGWTSPRFWSRFFQACGGMVERNLRVSPVYSRVWGSPPIPTIVGFLNGPQGPFYLLKIESSARTRKTYVTDNGYTLLCYEQAMIKLQNWPRDENGHATLL